MTNPVPSQPERFNGIHVETLFRVGLYSERQILFALGVARTINRGKLILTETPEGPK